MKYEVMGWVVWLGTLDFLGRGGWDISLTYHFGLSYVCAYCLSLSLFFPFFPFFLGGWCDGIAEDIFAWEKCFFYFLSYKFFHGLLFSGLRGEIKLFIALCAHMLLACILST